MNKIKAPKGFYFKVKNGYENYFIQLHKTSTNRRIGYINLIVCYNPNWLETHSVLDPEYHNKKLGALMYSKAIEWALDNGYRVRSSGCSSPDANRVWQGKTLRSNFRIRTKTQINYNCKNYIFYAYQK